MVESSAVSKRLSNKLSRIGRLHLSRHMDGIGSNRRHSGDEKEEREQRSERESERGDELKSTVVSVAPLLFSLRKPRPTPSCSWEEPLRRFRAPRKSSLTYLHVGVEGAPSGAPHVLSNPSPPSYSSPITSSPFHVSSPPVTYYIVSLERTRHASRSPSSVLALTPAPFSPADFELRRFKAMSPAPLSSTTASNPMSMRL